jgi:hypothetical protein
MMPMMSFLMVVVPFLVTRVSRRGSADHGGLGPLEGVVGLDGAGHGDLGTLDQSPEALSRVVLVTSRDGYW